MSQDAKKSLGYVPPSSLSGGEWAWCVQVSTPTHVGDYMPYRGPSLAEALAAYRAIDCPAHTWCMTNAPTWPDTCRRAGIEWEVNP